MWATAIVISLLAIVSKVLGCGLPMLGEGVSAALKVGVGMMPRGEVALIVALIELQMNVVAQQGYAVVIFMAGVTTVLAPPLLRFLFRHVEPEAGPPDQLETEMRASRLG